MILHLVKYLSQGNIVWGCDQNYCTTGIKKGPPNSAQEYNTVWERNQSASIIKGLTNAVCIPVSVQF